GLMPTRHEITAGLLVGLVTALLSASLAALIFTGDLREHLPAGIALSLLSAAVIGLVVAATSPYAGTVAIPQDRTAPILALLVGLIAARLAAEGADPFPTIRVALAVSALLTGAVLLVLGWCRLGELIRFIPYPVVGGLIARRGRLLVAGALRVMPDSELALAALPSLIRSDALLAWLPGCAFGILLFAAERRARGSLIVPALLVGGAVLFQGALVAVGMTHGEAQRHGLLFAAGAPVESPSLWTALASGDVHWRAIARQWGRPAALSPLTAVPV